MERMHGFNQTLSLVTAIIHCAYQIPGARLVCMDLTRPSSPRLQWVGSGARVRGRSGFESQCRKFFSFFFGVLGLGCRVRKHRSMIHRGWVWELSAACIHIT